MKYLIVESRFDKLINQFITERVGALQRHKHPNSSIDYIWWTDLDGRTVFEADEDDDGLSLGVSEDLWNSVNKMFSLNSKGTDKAFMTWMENYNGIKFPSGVYTLESDN